MKKEFSPYGPCVQETVDTTCFQGWTFRRNCRDLPDFCFLGVE